MRTWTGPPVLLFFVLSLLLCVACADDTRTPALLQPCGQGTIEIRSLSPVRPGPLSISLEPVEQDREFSIDARTDSAGLLVRDVPYGLYRMIVGRNDGYSYYVSHGRAAGYPQAETLAVGFPRELVRVDLALGALEIKLQLPSSVDGQEVFGIASLIQESVYVRYRTTARCQGGIAVLLFPAAVSGQYRVFADVGSNSSWMPFGSTEETGQLLSVEPGTQNVHEFAIPPPAVLRGDLRGAHQEVGYLYSDGSSITALTPDSIQVGAASIPERGAWVMTVIPAGPVRLRLVSGGIVRWIGGEDFASATVFTAASGETLQVPEEVESAIVLHLEGPREEIDYGPLIEVRDSTGTLLGQVGRQCDYCRSGNRFAIGNLRRGSYYVRLSPQRTSLSSTWSSMWLHQALTLAEATPIRVSYTGEIVPVIVHLWPAAVIRGRLLTQQPASYRWVEVRITAASDTLRSLATRYLPEPTEPFAFSGMESGSYLLCATFLMSGHSRRLWYPGVSWAAQAQPVRIDTPGQEQDVEWSLPR